MKMRKLVAVLMAVMMLCCIIPFSAVTASASATITFDSVSKRTEFDASHQVWQENGITIINNKDASTSPVADYAGPARFYKNSTLIVEYPGMTKIEFACNNASYATALQGAVVDASVSDKVVTVALGGVDSFSCVLSGGQVRVDSITVYGEGGDVVVPPVEPEEPDTPDVPDTPDAPTGDVTVVTEPDVDVAYKLGLDQTQKGAVYYFIGTMSNYYGATDTDVAKAVDMYLENADGGYKLYFNNASGVKQYIALVQSGNYFNFTYGAEGSVFTLDTELNALCTTVGDEVCYMGTYGTYVTMGVLRTSKLQETDYIARLYAVGGETPDTPDTPDVPDVPDVPVEPADSAVLDLTDKANRTSYSSTQQVWKQNGITVTNDKGASTTNVGDYGNPGRFYKGSTVTIEYPGMTAIVIDSVIYDDNDYATPWTAIDDANVTAATVADGNVTIVFANPVDSFTWDAMAAQGRAYTITVYTNGEVPEIPDEPDTPDTPDAPTGDAAVVTDPDVDVAYKLGLDQTQKGAVYYFIGTMSNYYGATDTDVAKAVDMYLENADGGYKLYFNNASGTKQYIALVQSGNYFNFTYGAEGSVFTLDTELNALCTTVGDEVCYMGTYGAYVTMGVLRTSKLQDTDYIARLYAVGGETPDVPACEHEYDDEYDADCNLCGEIREVPEKPIEYTGTIEIGTVEGSVGDTVQVPVTLPNNPGVISVKVKVHFDTAVLKIVGYEQGAFNGMYGWSSSLDEAMSKGYFIIDWFNGLGANDTSELLATLSFEILEGAAEELSVLTLEFSCEDNIFDADENTVYLQAVNGGVQVVPASASVPGDANGDGSVNNRDVALMQQYINKWEVSIDLDAGDVNNDGAVNNRDVALMQQYINKWDVELV